MRAAPPITSRFKSIKSGRGDVLARIMAEFATCSQDSVVFWDYKSFSSKRSSQPFGGAGYHIHSAAWSGSSKL